MPQSGEFPFQASPTQGNLLRTAHDEHTQSPQPQLQNPRRPVNGCWALLLSLMLLIGFIAATAFHQQQGIVENARRTDTRVLAKGIAEALVQYRADQGHYP